MDPRLWCDEGQDVYYPLLQLASLAVFSLFFFIISLTGLLFGVIFANVNHIRARRFYSLEILNRNGIENVVNTVENTVSHDRKALHFAILHVNVSVIIIMPIEKEPFSRCRICL